MQDTLRQKVIAGNDSLKQLHDTINHRQQRTDTVKVVQQPAGHINLKVITTDTSTVCSRGAIADVTFYDSTNFIRSIDTHITDNFPFTFTSINHEALQKRRESIIKSLKEGNEIPPQPYQSDWLVPLIVFAMFLFAVVRAFPGSFFRNMVRFLVMRGINENSSHDTGVLFQWQATLLNLASFTAISVFGYLTLKYYEISITGINGFVTWLIGLGVVVIVVTLRHFICNITGNFSGETEIFREYIIGIYHTYRMAGIILLVLSLMILYTTFLPVKVYFHAGIVVAGVLYLLRVVRLLLIFIIRHVSIFYLILYLCALEILPVVIIVKYVTGLV
jgi:hypothetical protein